MEKNRGFTLIELVLAMAAASIVFIMAGFLLSQGSDYYQLSKEELELQKEAQMTMAQLEQMLLNCNQLEQNADGTVVYIRQVNPKTKAVEKEEIITLRDNQLLLSKTENGVTIFSDRLMSRWIKAFSVTLPTEERNLVQAEILFEWNGLEYSAEQSIALRNTLAGEEPVDTTEGGA